MLVLDCNAAYEIAAKTTEGNALRKLILSGEKCISVDLLIPEMTSVLWKHALRNNISIERAHRCLQKTIAMLDEIYPAQSMYTEALNESIRLQHSTYDMYYFVLARRTGATLFTLDRKLADLCIANGVNAICVVDL